MIILKSKIYKIMSMDKDYFDGSKYSKNDLIQFIYDPSKLKYNILVHNFTKNTYETILVDDFVLYLDHITMCEIID